MWAFPNAPTMEQFKTFLNMISHKNFLKAFSENAEDAVKLSIGDNEIDCNIPFYFFEDVAFLSKNNQKKLSKKMYALLQQSPVKDGIYDFSKEKEQKELRSLQADFQKVGYKSDAILELIELQNDDFRTFLDACNSNAKNIFSLIDVDTAVKRYILNL